MKNKIVVALLAGTALLAACSGRPNLAQMDSLTVDSVMANPIIVKTADMRLKVKDVRATTAKITGIVSRHDGMVTHHDMQSDVVNKQDINLGNDSVERQTIYNVNARLTIKVPVKFIEPLMDSLDKMGVFVDVRKMDVEDKTLDVLKNDWKAENRRESIKLRERIKPTTQKVADSIMVLKDQAIDKKIDNFRTEIDANMSTLSLVLYQNNTLNREVIANDDLSVYKTPLSVRVVSAFSTGWYYFSEMVVIALHFWMFFLVGGGIWMVMYLYKRKRPNVPSAGA